MKKEIMEFLARIIHKLELNDLKIEQNIKMPVECEIMSRVEVPMLISRRLN